MGRARRSRGGRKRRDNVDRYPCGKPRQTDTSRPSDWVAGMGKRYGVHYVWPIGRAYASGLLGEDADSRYQATKKFVRLYKIVYGGSVYHCPLDDTPRSANDDEPVVTLNQREWLDRAAREMDDAGVRPWFDQLTSSLHHDAGPAWLDRLLDGGAHPADKMMLDAACKALDILAPPDARPVRIVAASW